MFSKSGGGVKAEADQDITLPKGVFYVDRFLIPRNLPLFKKISNRNSFPPPVRRMWTEQGSKHIEVAHLSPLPPSLARQGGESLVMLILMKMAMMMMIVQLMLMLINMLMLMLMYIPGSSDDKEGHNV